MAGIENEVLRTVTGAHTNRKLRTFLVTTTTAEGLVPPNETSSTVVL